MHSRQTLPSPLERFALADPWLRSREREPATGCRQQPVVKVRLHSAGAASRLAALLLAHILPVFSLVAPCHPGASPPSVPRRTFTTDCWPRRRRASLFFLRRWFEAAD